MLDEARGQVVGLGASGPLLPRSLVWTSSLFIARPSHRVIMVRADLICYFVRVCSG
jgi:hypothetical protein